MNTLARAFVGIVVGITLGGFIAMLTGNPDAEHRFRLPLIGACFGGMLIGIVAAIWGTREIRGRTKHVILGALMGTVSGLAFALVFGIVMAQINGEFLDSGKVQAGYRLVGIVIGMPVGAVVGAIVGLIVSLIKARLRTGRNEGQQIGESNRQRQEG